MSDKNHEQYLEQIETAVAEITMEILEKHSGDLRAMAKVCAEKQVEINRLKEHQSDDRSTIRNIRAHFKAAVDEATELKLRAPMPLEYYDDIIGNLQGEIEELKDEIECRHSTSESTEGFLEGENEKLKEQYTKAVQDINQRDFERTSLLKENEKLKSQITKLQASEARLDQSTVGSMLSTTLADLS